MSIFVCFAFSACKCSNFQSVTEIFGHFFEKKDGLVSSQGRFLYFFKSFPTLQVLFSVISLLLLFSQSGAHPSP